MVALGGPAAHDHTDAIAELVANFQRVQFEFDAASLSDASKSALSANAAIMKAHPKLSVEVQGHADERGTTEYNLALGERRAAAVRDYLANEGISPRRVVTISFGEEAPLDRAGTEVAWSANRRAEFRVLDGAELTVVGTTD